MCRQTAAVLPPLFCPGQLPLLCSSFVSRVQGAGTCREMKPVDVMLLHVSRMKMQL